MSAETQALYEQRRRRYLTALRNGKPDRVPIRPFAAEFVARYAGYTCQEVTHEPAKAFDATCRAAADMGWDATVPNMVYVWTGLTEAAGLKYYGAPGIGVDPNHGFQYLEPAEEDAWMRPDEYDALIADPTGYLYETWFPRVSKDVVAPGAPNTLRNNLAFVKGGMAMLQYFGSFGPAIQQLQEEAGAVPAIAGILKAPLDILGDKLRGYIGLTMDLLEQPEKVMAACEALAPHLCYTALTSADPDKQLPIGFWMHRGCTPFVTQEQFDQFYWPTLRPVIQELWKNGQQTLFYAEGDWDAHLEAFRDLPDQSIVYHVDRGDIFKAHDVLGDKFCLSGGISNYLLAYGTPEEVRTQVREVITGVAQDGGYLLDASAIMQNDATVENVRAMTQAGREFGDYNNPDYAMPARKVVDAGGVDWGKSGGRPAGVCVPWAERAQEIPQMLGDPDIVKRVWEEVDALGHTFIWQWLVSF
ncbi:MAG: uroporphyrinogen decarboxylase family protein [Candidatus Hydrogenedentota bacterium]